MAKAEEGTREEVTREEVTREDVMREGAREPRRGFDEALTSDHLMSVSGCEWRSEVVTGSLKARLLYCALSALVEVQ